jgi:hypothetical protein
MGSLWGHCTESKRAKEGELMRKSGEMLRVCEGGETLFG